MDICFPLEDSVICVVLKKIEKCPSRVLHLHRFLDVSGFDFRLNSQVGLKIRLHAKAKRFFVLGRILFSSMLKFS